MWLWMKIAATTASWRQAHNNSISSGAADSFLQPQQFSFAEEKKTHCFSRTGFHCSVGGGIHRDLEILVEKEICAF
jgi:hypothetical protein